jgi:anti-anti-sigma factor
MDTLPNTSAAWSAGDEQPADRVEVAYHSGTTAIVSIVGEHDLSQGDALRDALAAASSERRHVLVDFTHCSLLDSTGIALLLEAQQRVAARGGSLALVIPPEQGAVTRVAELIRLADLMPISATREEALATLGTPPSASRRSDSLA